MSRLVLQRLTTSDEGTFGELHWSGRKIVTGELPWRENRQGVSCVPPGVYVCKWGPTTRLGECYHLYDVPGRSGVLIHRGNFCGDEARGWSSDVEGCILLGGGPGMLTNDAGASQHCVVASGQAVADFVTAMKREDFELEIREIE